MKIVKNAGKILFVFIIFAAAIGCGVKRPPQPAYATPLPFKSDRSNTAPLPTASPSPSGFKQ